MLIDPIDYFPGDPPWADWLGLLMALASASMLLWGLVVRGGLALWRGEPLPIRRIVMIPAATLSLALLPGSVVLRRNFGDWARLKGELRAREAKIQRFQHDHPEGIAIETEAIFDAKKHASSEFRFTRAHSPVWLIVKVVDGEPHIGVSFGHGALAVFDPDTMFVVYSD